MTLFICLYLPSVLGIKILNIFENNMKKIDILLNYFILVLISNTLTTTLCRFLYGTKISFNTELSDKPMYAVKYIVFSILFNILVAIIMGIIAKNFEVSIEVVNNAKRRKKNKKTKTSN